MAHALILGITESGKTTLAQKLAKMYAEQGYNVLTLDPFKSVKWGADFITDDPDEFLRVAFQNTECALFIDEAGDNIGRYAREMRKLATCSRHYGHNAHFITQTAQSLDPEIRKQCVNAFIFKQSEKDAKIIAENYADKNFLKANELKQGEYLCKIGFNGTVEKHRIF